MNSSNELKKAVVGTEKWGNLKRGKNTLYEEKG